MRNGADTCAPGYLRGYDALSKYSAIPGKVCRRLVAERKIPVIRAGHRTVVFRKAAVDQAMQQLERKALWQ